MLQQLLPRLQSCGYRGLTQATLEGACDTRQLLSYLPLLGTTLIYSTDLTFSRFLPTLAQQSF